MKRFQLLFKAVFPYVVAFAAVFCLIYFGSNKDTETVKKPIAANFDEITLDMKFEFLVCAEMIDYEAETREKIRAEADQNKENFVSDPRKAARLNTLDGAEHRNVLYMMSGLDI
jgi:hypothetical protein